jgi:hypothetical protein
MTDLPDQCPVCWCPFTERDVPGHTAEGQQQACTPIQCPPDAFEVHITYVEGTEPTLLLGCPAIVFVT